MGYIVLAIVVLVVLAGVTLLTAMRRNDANRAIGELSRETKKRDRDLPTTVLQSHIHFGRPALTGSIVLFLCTNLTPPPNVPVPPACPQAPVGGASAKVSGTLTAANVISPTSTPQGLSGGDTGFAQIVAAIRNGAAYANVHTDQFKSGEIRGALGHPHDEADDDDNDD